MEKPIHINKRFLNRTELLSALERMRVEDFIEKALVKYIERVEEKRFAGMTAEEREDWGLLQMMEQVDLADTVDKEEFLKALHAR